MTYLGWPVVALGIGVVLSYRSSGPEDVEARRSDWIESALRTSAMIIVVTGLGGALSEILHATPAVDAIADGVAATGLPSIFLPFVLGVVGNLITGSTTVGVITAASISAPLMGRLGLSPEATMLAGAAGSVIVKYVNSSYFWVTTSLSTDAAAVRADLLRRRHTDRRRRVHGGRLRLLGRRRDLNAFSVAAPRGSTRRDERRADRRRGRSAGGRRHRWRR
jgi:hypothetical protein